VLFRSVLYETAELDDGWHRLRLVGLPSGTVAIDHLEAWAPGASLEPGAAATPVDEGAPGCGCTTGGRPGAALLLALAALRRSRRPAGSRRDRGAAGRSAPRG
jgi:hypothetical protein